MSKQERIVCPAVKFIFPNNGEKDEVIVPYVKNHKEEYHVFLLLTKLGVWRSTRYREELGFATSEQKFVDPIEAMQIAINAGQIEELVKNVYALAHLKEINHPAQIKAEEELIRLGEEYGARELKPEDLY